MYENYALFNRESEQKAKQRTAKENEQHLMMHCLLRLSLTRQQRGRTNARLSACLFGCEVMTRMAFAAAAANVVDHSSSGKLKIIAFNAICHGCFDSCNGGTSACRLCCSCNIYAYVHMCVCVCALICAKLTVPSAQLPFNRKTVVTKIKATNAKSLRRSWQHCSIGNKPQNVVVYTRRAAGYFNDVATVQKKMSAKQKKYQKATAQQTPHCGSADV